MNGPEIRVGPISQNGQAQNIERWFDVAAIAEACELLGIKEPVRVKTSCGRRTVGCHRYRIVGRYHSITVSRLRSVESMSKTLWHELAHSAQTERLGPKEFISNYRFQQSVMGYARNLFELEAKKAEEWHEALPLVREAQCGT